ncbi:nuclear transport factor 2 family protein [Pedobacter sp. ASV28]|uniref:nuclear transport factor 2 family protein n=1 Tax=Pedobacter sp. ASV28 TaxID=2795123 RepID=UPI0018EA5884|nr:nuclear transport factor 2 family protein [Pedobacter sp. ASV28]
MKKVLIITICYILLGQAHAFPQSRAENDIRTTINNLFNGMKNNDTTLIRKAFADKNIMQTIVKTKDGKAILKTESLDNFIKSISRPRTEKYDERITFTKILIDDHLASVWTDYKFYVDDQFSHCGVNSFQLLKSEDGWKIIYLIDTRRKDSCN